MLARFYRIINEILVCSKYLHVTLHVIPYSASISIIGSFLCPHFEEVEGTYWFGPICLSVHPSVCFSFCRL